MRAARVLFFYYISHLILGSYAEERRKFRLMFQVPDNIIFHFLQKPFIKIHCYFMITLSATQIG